MRESLMKKLDKFVKDDSGAEIAEYAISVALLVAIGVVVYVSIANAFAYSNSSTAGAVENVPRTFIP